MMGQEQMAKAINPERQDSNKNSLVMIENIQYGFESDRQTMDIYLWDEPHGPMPVIVWIHGGGWSSEELDKRYRPESQFEQLVKNGLPDCQH